MSTVTTDQPVSPHVPGDEGAARYLHLSPRFVRGKRLSGELKSFKIGKRIFYRIADLDAYIERAVQATEQKAEPAPAPEVQRPRRRRRQGAVA